MHVASKDKSRRLASGQRAGQSKHETDYSLLPHLSGGRGRTVRSCMAGTDLAYISVETYARPEGAHRPEVPFSGPRAVAIP